MRRILISVGVAIGVSCSIVGTPSPSIPARPTYAYSLVIPITDLHPGDAVTMRWQATRNGETSQQPGKLRLCFAIIGPYASVQDAKASAQGSSDCPVSPNGAVYVSPVLEADPLVDMPMSQGLTLPRDLPAGLYNVIQVTSFGGGNFTSATGTVRVVVTAQPTPSGPRPWATICGRISDFLADGIFTQGSFVLNSPGRDPIVITIPAGRLGGVASGYVCVGVQAGTSHPLFDGFDVSGGPGFVPETVFPASRAFPAPLDFNPPQVCAYVAPPRVIADQTEWSIDCGATNNSDTRGTLSGQLKAAGWTLCGFGAAAAQWQKGNIRLGIAESSLAPGDYPRFSQRTTTATTCG